MAEEKAKEKKPEKQEKPKTQSREFTVSFRKCKVKGKQDIEKAKHAIALLRKFFKKHYRKQEKEILISNEVNQEVWKNSNNIKNRLQFLAVEKEGKLKIYLKDSRELKAEEEARKEKAKKAAEEKSKTAGIEAKPAAEKTEAKTEKPASAGKIEAKIPSAERKEEKTEVKK